MSLIFFHQGFHIMDIHFIDIRNRHKKLYSIKSLGSYLSQQIDRIHRMTQISAAGSVKRNVQPQKTTVLNQALIVEEVFPSHKKLITSAIILDCKNTVIQASLADPRSAGSHESPYAKSPAAFLVFLHCSQITICQLPEQMTDFVQRMTTCVDSYDFLLLLQLIHQLPWL